MLEVVKPGLETSVQDLPGRLGYWEQGFPPSGPMDVWSFRLANLLVGNAANDAGLECQFIGPTLRFREAAVIAVAGANMGATLDGSAIPMWETVRVRAGQLLALGPALTGARTYLAFCGGIDVPEVLSSRSTFHVAGIGGMEGGALKAGQIVPVGMTGTPPARSLRVRAECRPEISTDRRWTIEICEGPNDDWIASETKRAFCEEDWTLTAKSNRTGFRLAGPEWNFAPRAIEKNSEHGEHPSNILDHGYPVGCMNLGGQTPIILVNDSPSTGGFINPYTVPSCAFWKLAQSRPGETYRFAVISVAEAQERAAALDDLCTLASLEEI